jgi:hypothetical protein
VPAVNGEEFRRLSGTIAGAWNEGDTTSALACFTDDARYAGPPDTQHYEDRHRFEFFGGDDPPPMMAWHTILIDRDQQMGAAGYTYTGTNTDHGVAVIRLRDDLVANWREYQVRSDLYRQAFTALNPF